MSDYSLDLKTGKVIEAIWTPSPNFDERPDPAQIETIIVHCISLPPGKYGGGYVEAFFQNQLDPNAHNYFKNIAQLAVSSHFLIDRCGQLTQFVATNHRAWHAGESFCQERGRMNDCSVGIELEGLDTDPAGFMPEQYETLRRLIACLRASYPKIGKNDLYSHSDIAPERKPDPGPYFDWHQLYL